MKKIHQPKGLFVIAGTEIFERISFYSISFNLVLYTSAAKDKGGLGWLPEHALYLAGLYTFAAFTLPLIGGFLADKFIGSYRSVVLGALMIMMGHLLLYFATPHHRSILYFALLLTSIGTGFLKPCMPTLLGRLYPPNDIRQDGGFKIYYMGINVGGMIAGILSGSLAAVYGYQLTLSMAAIGMLTGLIVFVLGSRYLNISDAPMNSKVILPENTIPLTELHKRSLKYLGLSFIFLALWCVAYNIALSGTLSYYIEKFTSRTAFGFEIPTTYFMSWESLSIIISAPIISYILIQFAAKRKKVHFFSQMNFALFIVSIGMFYLTYLSYKAQNVIGNELPFHYPPFLIFIFLVAVSEVMMSPVMMSAISILSPSRYRGLLQGVYLAALGLTGLLAGKIGAISLKHPFETFLIVSVILGVGSLIFFAIQKNMVHVAEAAENEMEKQRNTSIA